MPPGGSLVVLDTSVVSLFLRNADEAVYYRSEIEGLRAVISFPALWHHAAEHTFAP